GGRSQVGRGGVGAVGARATPESGLEGTRGRREEGRTRGSGDIGTARRVDCDPGRGVGNKVAAKASGVDQRGAGRVQFRHERVIGGGGGQGYAWRRGGKGRGRQGRGAGASGRGRSGCPARAGRDRGRVGRGRR